MQIDILCGLNQWYMFAGLFLLLIIASEVGFWISRISRRSYEEPLRTQYNLVQAAALGLLALLLGFTMAMSMQRFETRRIMVVDEANAVGTTYLRARLLPEPERSRIEGLLATYVDARLDFAKPGCDDEFRQKLREKFDMVQNDIWALAVDLGKKDPHNLMTSLFIQSLNEMIDLDTQRMAAVANHVPKSVLIVLCFVSIMTFGLVGYGYGMAGRTKALSPVMTALLISIVITLIVDLDRPRQGLGKVSQQSMKNLRHHIVEADAIP